MNQDSRYAKSAPGNNLSAEQIEQQRLQKIRTLINTIQKGHTLDRPKAVTELRYLWKSVKDREIFDILVSSLYNYDENVVIRAEMALEGILRDGGRPVIELFAIGACQNEQYLLKLRAEKILAKIGVDPLADAVRSENPNVRRHVAKALGNTANHSAIEPLKSMLQDENKDVRLSATEALKKLGWKPD
jgi:hypothetical protein